MNSVSSYLNLWAGHLSAGAWPMLWQSSLLIALVWALDVALRRQARAAVRYSLWLLVLLKLVLPPSLAAPTAPGWWVRSKLPPPAPRYVAWVRAVDPQTVPTGRPAVSDSWLSHGFVLPPPPPERLSRSAWALILSGAVSLALLAWVLARWRCVVRQARRGTPGPAWLADLLEQERRRAGLRRPVRLRLIEQPMSPAVCGLFRPVILLPRTLVDQLSPECLRPILLHELIHLRRGDVWVSWAQAMLQILYWWHPLVWLANACIRRAREEAVDDAVLIGLKGEAECYAPTLLAVARLGLPRSLAALGLVGILESRSALRRRIERLVQLPAPRRAGLTLTSCLCLLAFAAVALPMGQGPGVIPSPVSIATTNVSSPADLTSPGRDGAEIGRDQPLVKTPQDWDRTIAETEADLERSRAAWKTAHPHSGNENAGPIDLAQKVRQLNTLRIETQAEFVRQQALLKGLKALNGQELIQALPTAVSDDLLNDLLKKQTEADQRLADARKDYGPQHPEVLKATSQVEDLKQRINKRVEGILMGMAAKVDSLGQGLTNLTQEVEKSIKEDGAAVRLQDGKLLYEMGKLDEAEAKLKAVRAADPGNRAAQYYLNLVREARLNTAVTDRPAYSRTNVVFSGRGRQLIYHQLDTIRMENVGPWQNAPLGEVVRLLNQEALKRDPEGRGINFIVSSTADTPPPAAIDPATGLPLAGGASPESVDLAQQVAIKIDPPLHDLRLADVLDAIVKVADHPIKYSIEDYAVIFSWRGTAAGPLYFRAFKVDPNTFQQGLQGVAGFDWGAAAQAVTSGGGSRTAGGGGGIAGVVAGLPGATETNSMVSIQADARRFFAHLGVDLSPPKSLFFSGTQGTMMAYASLPDLDTIGRALATFNTPPPQVHIRTWFIELPEAEAKAFAARYSSTNSPSGSTVRLTPSQAREQIKRWTSLEGAKPLTPLTFSNHVGQLLSEAAVTTLSGRQAEIGLTDLGRATGTNGALPSVPMLDVIPYVAADGFCVQLGLTATLAEFIGYDDPGQFVINAFGGGTNGQLPLTPLQPCPHFRLHDTKASVSLWDGQTVVFGSWAAKDEAKSQKAVGPMPTDVPLIGHLFRGDPGQTNLTHIVVVVTPTIIDPAGNRVHSDTDLPFAETSFPPEGKPAPLPVPPQRRGP